MNILITGGASGLGLAIAKSALAVSGNHVIISYSNSEIQANLLKKNYENLSVFHCDFKNSESVSKFCSMINELDIDVLINNALTGITQKHFHKLDGATIEAGFTNNVLPTVLITQACIKAFRKRKSGKIITILTSYLHGLPPTGLSTYVAEKNYLLSMSKSWESENKKFNIQSLCVSPTFMLTPLNQQTDERIIQKMIEHSEHKSLLKPETVALVVQNLIAQKEVIDWENILIDASA